jgi:uncharacterized caspase-like protein
MQSFGKLASALLLLLAAATGAAAQPRLALVIGNSSYQFARPLATPVRDANAMSNALRVAGFQVTSATNLTRAEMSRVVREFSTRVAQQGSRAVALVYYTGHAVQVEGRSFLVPIDARIGAEADVVKESILLSDVVQMVSTRNDAPRITIVDASRSDPFSSGRFSKRGLATVNAPVNSLVAYSTAPGSIAEDGNGPVSPYTAALTKTIQEQGLPIEEVFKRVRLTVNKATNGRQIPWETSSLTSDFSFAPGASR